MLRLHRPTLPPTMSLPTALPTGTPVQEVIHIATTPPAVPVSHEWPVGAPAHAHDPRLSPVPSRLRIRGVKHAPDLGPAGPVDGDEVAVSGTVGRGVVAGGLDEGVFGFLPGLRGERVAACEAEDVHFVLVGPDASFSQRKAVSSEFFFGQMVGGAKTHQLPAHEYTIPAHRPSGEHRNCGPSLIPLLPEYSHGLSGVLILMGWP